MTCPFCEAGCMLCEGSGIMADFVSFPSLLERLHAQRHTGPVIFHFAQGKPNSVEIPSAPTRIKLDKRAE